MKLKLFSAIALSTALVTASAQSPTTETISLVCDKTSIVIKTLVESYGETPTSLFKSEDGNVDYLLFENNKTNTWSFVAVIRNVRACVMATGKGIARKGNV